MSKVYFSTWNGEFVNNIGKHHDEWEESALICNVQNTLYCMYCVKCEGINDDK